MASFWKTRQGRGKDCMKGRQGDDCDDLLLQPVGDGLKLDSEAKGSKFSLHGLHAAAFNPNSNHRSQCGRGVGVDVARSRLCQVPISSQHLAPPPTLPVMASPMGNPLVLLRVAPKYCG